MVLSRALMREVGLRLPARRLEIIPEVDMAKAVVNGRCVHDGYQRGWGLQFGDLGQLVARDPLFRAAYSAAKNNPKTRTVVRYERLANLFLILKYYAQGLASHNVVEFGSYRGGSALFMAVILAELYPDARVYALDTFGGMPETDSERDLHRAGDFSDTNIEAIREAADHLGLHNLELVKGLVEDTAPCVYERAGQFGLAHLDLDIYSGLKFAQDSVWPFMAPGGYVVYDDATVSSCIGATQAVEELIIERRLNSEQVYPHFVFRAQL